MSTPENVKAQATATAVHVDDRDGTRPEKHFDTFRMSLLTLGHLANDGYSNFVPPLLPLLKAAYGLSYAASGILMTVYTITSNIIQPVFGYYADRHGRRWLVAFSMAWIAVVMSLIGLVGYLGLDSTGSYTVILVLVGLAGLGSALYHPQASVMVPQISGDRKGFGMSLFSAGGNLGYAVMPLLVVPVTAIWGLKGATMLMIPGLAMALLLYKYAPQAPSSGARVRIDDIVQDFRASLTPLAAVIGMVFMRAWVYFGLMTFLPLYMDFRHETPGTASIVLFILLFFSAVGGLIGGFVSDAYGNKPVIVWSMLLTAPLAYLALASQGYAQWALMALAGSALLASFSPGVLVAQELLPKSQGIASGIILGFAVGIGGLGVAVTGAISDSFGITAGMFSLVALPVLGAIIALALPGKVMPTRSRL